MIIKKSWSRCADWESQTSAFVQRSGSLEQGSAAAGSSRRLRLNQEARSATSVQKIFCRYPPIGLIFRGRRRVSVGSRALLHFYLWCLRFPELLLTASKVKCLSGWCHLQVRRVGGQREQWRLSYNPSCLFTGATLNSALFSALVGREKKTNKPLFLFHSGFFFSPHKRFELYFRRATL